MHRRTKRRPSYSEKLYWGQVEFWNGNGEGEAIRCAILEQILNACIYVRIYVCILVLTWFPTVFAGIKAMMVVVADDVALPEGKGITGGRGIAGTVFVHKVAGGMV